MQKEIISQYKASLKMLENVIGKCPDKEWNNEEYKNPFWRIVYHTLFYTSLYLSESPAKFTEWNNHKKNYNLLGNVTQENKPIIIETVYSKKEMIEYLQSVINQVDNSVTSNLGNEKSSFYWLSMSRIELHLYNIRHVQHHVGQLVERLHNLGFIGITWESTG